MDFYPFYFSTDFYSTTLHLAKNSIFYRSFIPTFQRSFLYPGLPVAKSERIHVRSKARPSMTHDIIGSPCHPGSSTAPCEIQFLRVQSIESIRHFVLFRYKTVHGGFFFLLSFSFSTGCSSLRALFQLSGSGSGKEITKIPIFIRSFTSKIQSYLVSFRMVHV